MLPKRSSNRRSFCRGSRPPRTIEISRGVGQRGEARPNKKCLPRTKQVRPDAPPMRRRDLFAHKKSPPLPAPCESRGFSTRATRTTAARGARATWPCDDTAVSAKGPRLMIHHILGGRTAVLLQKLPSSPGPIARPAWGCRRPVGSFSEPPRFTGRGELVFLRVNSPPRRIKWAWGSHLLAPGETFLGRSSWSSEQKMRSRLPALPD